MTECEEYLMCFFLENENVGLFVFFMMHSCFVAKPRLCFAGNIIQLIQSSTGQLVSTSNVVTVANSGVTRILAASNTGTPRSAGEYSGQSSYFFWLSYYRYISLCN